MRNDALPHSLIFIGRMVSQTYHRSVLESEKLCTIVAKIAPRMHNYIFIYTWIQKENQVRLFNNLTIFNKPNYQNV